MATLLIVDDEPEVGRSISENVDWASVGFETTIVATSGKECMDICPSYRPAVVLMDVRLPDANGIDLAMKVHQTLEHSQVVVLSGYQDFQNAARALEAGVRAYLTKPISYTKLVEVVRDALAGYHSTVAHEQWCQQAEHVIDELLPLMRERVLADWLKQGRITQESAIRRLTELKCGVKTDSVGVVLAVEFNRIAKEGSDRGFYAAMLGAASYLRNRIIGIQWTADFWPEERVIAIVAAFDTEKALATWSNDAAGRLACFDQYCTDSYRLNSNVSVRRTASTRQ